MKPDRCPTCKAPIVKSVFNTDFNDPHFMCGSILVSGAMQTTNECRLQAAINSMREDIIDLQRQRDKAHNALREIKARLEGPAGNRRFMQIAEPARACLNIIKGVFQ